MMSTHPLVFTLRAGTITAPCALIDFAKYGAASCRRHGCVGLILLVVEVIQPHSSSSSQAHTQLGSCFGKPKTSTTKPDSVTGHDWDVRLELPGIPH
eukprot:m.482039 g.482039  ORF g.482039 m.482039 type:complete len:97 (+) comp58847_c0_seq1:35-325(+)